MIQFTYIKANGPIGLMPLKALKWYFVQWAAEALAERKSIVNKWVEVRARRGV